MIDPIKLAQRNSTLTGEVSLGKCDRLSDFLLDSSREVNYRLQFEVDVEGWPTITGHIHTILTLTCQRCLQPMEHPLALDVALAVAAAEKELARVPEHYEAFLIPEAGVTIEDIITDEILLALPLVPKHNDERCEMPAKSTANTAQPQGRQAFADLAKLITKSNES